MIVRKHKRVNKEKDELLVKIRLISPDANPCRHFISLVVKAGNNFNSKNYQIEIPKMEHTKLELSEIEKWFPTNGICYLNKIKNFSNIIPIP